MCKAFIFLFCAALQPLLANFPSDLFLVPFWHGQRAGWEFQSKGHPLGSVSVSLLPWDVLLEEPLFLHDAQGLVEAYSTIDVLDTGTLLHVFDSSGNPLGSIRETIINFMPRFEIFSANKELVAKGRVSFWGNHFVFEDPLTLETLADFYWPFLSLKRRWEVHLALKEESKLDPRLLHS